MEIGETCQFLDVFLNRCVSKMMVSRRGVSKKERGKLGVKTCGPNFPFWRLCDTPRTKRVFLSVDMLLALHLDNAPGTRINRS